MEEASGVLEDEPPAVNAEEPAEPVTAQPDDEIAAPVESPAADADAVEAADAEEGEEPAAADEFTEAQRLIKRRLRCAGYVSRLNLRRVHSTVHRTSNHGRLLPPERTEYSLVTRRCPPLWTDRLC